MALSDKEKKRAQREREKDALEKHGGRRITLLLFGDTLRIVERLCKENNFVGQQRIAECLTHLIHENFDDPTKVQD